MSPFPTGTETGGNIPYDGQFFDKGGAVYNVMHPDFGAKGDGANDDGVAWNLAVTNMPTGGGTILVPAGSYALTTAFSFAAKDDITLFLMPGVVLTGSALPTPAGDNNILDLRDGGFAVAGAASVGAAKTGAFFNIQPGIAQLDLVTSVGIGFNIEADTWDINAAGNGETKAIAALAFFGIPTWTSTGTTLTLTDAATVYIQGIPVDSTNVTATNKYALWVDAGEARFDGAVTSFGSLVADLVSGAAMDFSAGTARYVSYGADTSTAGKTQITNASSNSSVLHSFTFSSNVFLVNDTANTKMTIGITINQGADDDEIFAVKSSDVAHGMTDLAETDTYGTLSKSAGTSGGLSVIGYKDADGVGGEALFLLGRLGEAADTTKSTSGKGVIAVQAAIKSSATVGAVGTDGNLMTIDNNGTTRFIFDAEGTAHADDVWTDSVF